MRPTPRWANTIAMLLVLVAALAAYMNPLFRPQRSSTDFNTFYCAGQVIDQHADPYRAEPLGSCERRPIKPQLVHVGPGVAMPAPLPPYALLPFALLAQLPYFWAFALWSIVIVGAAAATLWAARRTTGIPLPALVAAFGLGTLVALELGQVAPIATAGVALCAYFASKRRDVPAALAAACAMIEPHVALPACVALFLWMPRTRITLALAGLACLGASFLLVGPSVALEYLRDVLPLHALSEVSNHQQLSLTYVAHRLGVAPAPAVRLGEFCYAAMLALGVAVAGTFARRKLELIPSLPVAFVLFGGTFVHAVQLPAALPAALILFVDARSAGARRLLAAAIILLALPFVQFTSLWPCSVTLYGAAAVILVATFLQTPALPSLACAAVACAIPFALWTTAHFPMPPSSAGLVSSYDPNALADVSWTRYVNLSASVSPLALDIVKLPPWLGLATVLTLATASCFRRPKDIAGPAPTIESVSRYSAAR